MPSLVDIGAVVLLKKMKMRVYDNNDYDDDNNDNDDDNDDGQQTHFELKNSLEHWAQVS